MSTQITRLPVGLQDFLGTQAQGKNPSDLAQVVAPTIDYGSFIGVRNEKWRIASTSGITGNSNEIFEVPEGEFWVLDSLGVTIIPAGITELDTLTVSAYLDRLTESNAAAFRHAFAGPFVYEAIGTQGGVSFSQSLGDVVATPGSRITVAYSQVKITGGGSMTGDACLRYQRLKI